MKVDSEPILSYFPYRYYYVNQDYFIKIMNKLIQIEIYYLVKSKIYYHKFLLKNIE